MDILTHVLSGVAAGATLASFSTKGSIEKGAICILGGIGGCIPDIDVISLWSGFDGSIGHFFHLKHSGHAIYSANYWYSHHGIMHSIFAAILLTFLMGTLHFIIQKKNKDHEQNWLNHLLVKKLMLFSFLSGYLLHLLEDMPTPASTWGGIHFLWPFPNYTGGTGDIWWWNNYDIFLVVLGVLILNSCVLVLRKFFKFNPSKYTAAIFIIGFMAVVVQIKTRDYNFAYTGHTNTYMEFETMSKRQQEKILGTRLFHIMETIDNKLTIHF